MNGWFVKAGYFMATAVYPALLLLNSKEKVLSLNTLKRLTCNMFLLLFGEFSRSVLVQTNFYSQFHVGYFFEARKSYYIA